MRANTLTLTTTTEFFIEECCNCGVAFGMTTELKNQRNADKKSFYCPNGHGQNYVGKTDAQLRREAEAAAANAQEEARIARAATKRAEQELHMARTEHQRQMKRASAGVCPCCNRSFVQLARHMKCKHPDYAP